MTAATDTGTGREAPLSRDQILAIERAAVYAWPANDTAHVGGWLWRHSSGGSQRANSVSTLDDPRSDAEAAIDAVEARYRALAAPVRIQVVDRFSQPGDLDARLARRGYVVHDPVTALARRCTSADMPADVTVMPVPSDAWMDVYLANVAADRRPAAPAIVARVPAPRAFFGAMRDGELVSTALGVLYRNVVIAECVGTRADVRRSGGAAAAMRAVEAWGRAQGAEVIALHAVTANAPAQALYAALGYVPVGRSHYRFKA